MIDCNKNKVRKLKHTRCALRPFVVEAVYHRGVSVDNKSFKWIRVFVLLTEPIIILLHVCICKFLTYCIFYCTFFQFIPDCRVWWRLVKPPVDKYFCLFLLFLFILFIFYLVFISTPPFEQPIFFFFFLTLFLCLLSLPDHDELTCIHHR